MHIVPPDVNVLTRLGYCLLEIGRHWHARQRLQQALAKLNVTDNEFIRQSVVTSRGYIDLLLGIGATYVLSRRFEEAQDAYHRAFAHMPNEERAYYDDITHVARESEALRFTQLQGDARVEYIRRFWAEHDPTPVTNVNERELEHYRRVWYARRHFSRSQVPWDRRGSVYIRYGEPAHRSSKKSPNFLMDRRTEAARERLARLLYGPQVVMDGLDPSGPVYPGIMIGSDTEVVDWEEWIYPHVGNGLVVLFTDEYGSGEYGFAKPPPMASLNMAAKLQMFSPENEFLSARKENPEVYVYDETQAPLDFPFYLAQFRADSGRTELDVYYGIPLTELMPRTRGLAYECMAEHGIALFDTTWQVMQRSMGHFEISSWTRPKWEPGPITVERQSAQDSLTQ